MATLQLILIITGIIILVFLLVAAFLPGKKYFERSIVINSEPEKVYSLITDFRNYKKWNPWSHREPGARGEMSGQPGHTGHRWEWEGRIIGTGSLTIREYEPAKYVKSDLIFLAPRRMTSEDIWQFEALDKNKTKVKWANYSELAYPMERYYGLFLDKMLGPDFEQGLTNLKNLSES